MKLLTIAVPCYNSQEYMHYCIQSLVTGGDQVEVLIINDGSSDNTQNIAEKFEQQYPGIVRAISQENKGHGGAVNTGMQHATGKYFKVVDSDDWVDVRAYLKILEHLQQLEETQEEVDVVITNFVYEKEQARRKKIMRYQSSFPENKVFTWDDAKSLRRGKYMMMHSLIYNMNLLRKSGLQLPEHTFYVDNLFVFVPLQYSKTLFYMNVDFYRYFIGREDQSVNESVMTSRVDQQLRITRIMMHSYHLYDDVKQTKLRNYMMNYFTLMMAACSIFSKLSEKPGADEALKNIWTELKYYDPKMYRRARMGLVGIATNLPSETGKKATIGMFHMAAKLVKFN